MNIAKWKLTVIAVVLFVAGGVFAWGMPLTSLAPQLASAAPALNSEEEVMAIYDNVIPSVVEINVTQGSGIGGGFYSEGLGSGFIVDNDGNIMTNQHVVDGATKVSVTFSNGDTADATVVGTDTIHDLALIKVAPTAIAGLTPLQFADSSTVRPGQTAIALGAPLGLANSITVGVISGLDRNVSGSALTGMLQTDATINPGNSGGPLLNSSGQVVGINTAIEVQAGARGIGFAVPSNVAKNALPALKAGKQVQRAWLGITGMTLTSSLASQLGLSVNQGVYVISVTPDSPAEKAGLKGSGTDSTGEPAAGGDVITTADGNPMNKITDLTNYIAGNQVGDEVTLSVLHGGNNTDIKVTLGTWPTNTSIGRNPNTQPMPNTPLPWPWGGRNRPSVPVPQS